jgi:hypothetical protein
MKKTSINANTEATPCNGNVALTIDQNKVTCAFASLTQGAICSSCPWSKLCALIQNTPAQQQGKVVMVKAFTGMPIGEFPITHETKTSIEVTTNKGDILKFDRKSGAQMNAKNPKYANRIEVQ